MPSRSPAWARARFGESRVARLATVAPDGAPRLVPVVFALVGDVIVTAVDHKPKSTTRLRRLDNIAGEPRVSLLVDAYGEDWGQLWWARADGSARIAEAGDVDDATVAALVARYPQYADRAPGGPYVLIEVQRWSGWSAR